MQIQQEHISQESKYYQLNKLIKDQIQQPPEADLIPHAYFNQINSMKYTKILIQHDILIREDNKEQNITGSERESKQMNISELEDNIFEEETRDQQLNKVFEIRNELSVSELHAINSGQIRIKFFKGNINSKQIKELFSIQIIKRLIQNKFIPTNQLQTKFNTNNYLQKGYLHYSTNYENRLNCTRILIYFINQIFISYITLGCKKEQIIQVGNILKKQNSRSYPIFIEIDVSGMGWNSILLNPLMRDVLELSNLTGVCLQLQGNKISRNGIVLLSSLFRQTRNVRYWDIDLTRNTGIDDKGYMLLQELTLHNGKDKTNNIQLLNNAFNYTNTNSMAIQLNSQIILSNKITLSHLNLHFRECIQITDSSIFTLLESIILLKPLISLGLGFDVLKLHSNTQKLLILLQYDVDKKVVQKHRNLEQLVLHLSYTRFEKKMLTQIGKVIKTMNEIRKLELGYQGNQVDSNAFNIFLQALDDKPLIKTLNLDFSFNNIEGKTLPLLANKISKLHILETIKLNLSKNKQFERFPLELAEILWKNNIKGELFMNDCNISQEIISRIWNILNSFILSIEPN